MAFPNSRGLETSTAEALVSHRKMKMFSSSDDLKSNAQRRGAIFILFPVPFVG